MSVILVKPASAPNAPYLHLDTSELRTGDLVLSHGMRLLIDGDIVKYEGNPSGRTCYRTEALLLNEEESVRDHGIPRSWLREDKYVPGTGWTQDPADAPRWGIQGNDLATWCVQRAGWDTDRLATERVLTAFGFPE